MRIAHFDCFSGASGDMVLGALIDAGADVGAIRQGLASFGLPIEVEIENVRKGGFRATYVRIEAPEESTHRFLPDVEEILNKGSLSSRQRTLALRIFRRLAEAESSAHGMPLDRVHFHEVGALDSIADIAGCAIGIDLLGIDRFTSRSVPTGHGTVKCAHGLMPIPAPGTAELLKGVPLAASPIKAELTTPTGAAILTTIVQEWQESPVMTVERIGHGAGRRDFPEQPNLLRLFVGTAPDSETQATGAASKDRAAHIGPDVAAGLGTIEDEVWMLETNLDDLPAEVIGYCYDLLLSAGALDVFSTPIQMKKNRPGVLFNVLAPAEAVAGLEEIMFRETGTLGIRRYRVSRHKLQRSPSSVATGWGPVQGKLGWRAGRPAVFSPEYDDCARIARQHGVPFREVYAAAEQAWRAQGERGASAP